jgi:DNA-binding transcriptional LysR family regulator
VQIGQLRAFLAVAERRHFTKAARALGMAQPSVSAHVRRLEAEIGQTLFHRLRGSVALTPAGEALLPFARRIVADVEAATAELHEVGGLARGRLAVGATPSLAATLLPAVLSRFHAAYPGIDLVVRESGSRELVAALEEGTVDIALVILPVRQDVLQTEPLLREELVVAVAKTHPLASRHSLSVSELRDVPLVMFREGYDLRASTEAAFREAGFAPTFAVEGGEMDGVLRLTAAGLGAAIVPSLVIETPGPLRAIRIAGAGLTRTIGLAHRRDRRLSRAGQELIDIVKTLVRDRPWLKTTPAGLTVLR